MDYNTIVHRQKATDGTYCYIALHPELLGSMSQGDTPEEAEANLVEATELVLAHLKVNNLPIPKPMPSEKFFQSFTMCEGETIPYEVALVGSCRELTIDEIEHGKELEKLAMEYLKGSPSVKKEMAS